MSTNWRYTDSTNRVVVRNLENGAQESCLAEVLADITPEPADVPPIEEIRASALVEIRKQRSPILDALAGIGFDALMAGDTATAQAVATARTGLKNITTLQALEQASTYDEMKSVVLNEYRLIAATAPLAVQKAILEVVAS